MQKIEVVTKRSCPFCRDSVDTATCTVSTLGCSGLGSFNCPISKEPEGVTVVRKKRESVATPCDRPYTPVESRGKKPSRIDCEVNYDTMENDEGITVDGVFVTCSRCGHVVESYGTGEKSVKRCLALMREECPRGEKNYYNADDGGDRI